jgi:hypothetical protein
VGKSLIPGWYPKIAGQWMVNDGYSRENMVIHGCLARHGWPTKQVEFTKENKHTQSLTSKHGE